MNVLIFSEKRNAAYDTRATQLTDELKHRGHEVHTLSVMQEHIPSLQYMSLRRWTMQKKHYETTLRERAKKLKKQLDTLAYDVIIATNVTCAQTMSMLCKKTELFFPFMVYVSSADEPLRSKHPFFCDAYIIRNEAAQNALLRQKIASGLIHLIPHSEQETSQICTCIEKETRQWKDMIRMFNVGF